MLKSLLIAAATVAFAVVLVLVDPLLLQVFKAAVPQIGALRSIAAAMEYTLIPPVLIGATIVYVLVFRPARRRRSWVFIGTEVAQGILVSTLKRVFSRMRPDELPVSFGFCGPMWHHEYKSFPGGHAAGSFALAALLSCWHPRWKWAFYTGATIITLSRIYLQRHFFSDCFIGASLGYWIAQTFLHYFEPRKVVPAPEGSAAFLEVAEEAEPA